MNAPYGPSARFKFRLNGALCSSPQDTKPLYLPWQCHQIHFFPCDTAFNHWLGNAMRVIKRLWLVRWVQKSRHKKRKQRPCNLLKRSLSLFALDCHMVFFGLLNTHSVILYIRASISAVVLFFNNYILHLIWLVRGIVYQKETLLAGFTKSHWYPPFFQFWIKICRGSQHERLILHVLYYF